jgi:hypothetical protein
MQQPVATDKENNREHKIQPYKKNILKQVAEKIHLDGERGAESTERCDTALYIFDTHSKLMSRPLPLDVSSTVAYRSRPLSQ